ncbi:hypothetical protein Tsubulata_029671 [Turnera subulata]|uniref:Uncharacterized protein n=1 Tax=Turnera subulata TaxID=218843 RepID=A0A9Q0JDX3_9ROSI|nr:hypothetical protein Tsubulata_029671 [Turnera subulata]
MASSNNFDRPHFPPPPPPHVLPPPPSPPSDDTTTIIVIVFVSFGGILFLSFLAAAILCFMKKKKKKTTQETDIVRLDEHLKVKEAIVPGPHGPHAVVLEVEDDIHADEIIRKNEKVGQGGFHANPTQTQDNIVTPQEAAPGSVGSKAAAIVCCFMIKKKNKAIIEETDVVHFDEHLEAKEAIVQGPHHVPQAVVLEIEDDVHVDKIARKEDKVSHSLQAKGDEASSGNDHQVGATSSSSSTN